MALRCLVFSSNEEMVKPVWQVLTDLGIEGEYCQSAVDAVEKVTTQQFHIVVTDWDDQPEAAFLLKTARDLKAAQRPLTLAIVTDDARPEALKAGANSVLLKPIRAERVRDTMSTACELLRAKQHLATPPQTAASTPPESAQTATMAAAASAGTVSMPTQTPSSVPSSVDQPPEKTFRAGEFLHSPGPAPGAQFETEDTETRANELMEEGTAEEAEALTELEPTASAVEEAPAAEPVAVPEPEKPVTGWAALQTRLMRTAPTPAEDAPAKSELLSYGETPSFGKAAEAPAEGKDTGKNEPSPGAESEAEPDAYLPGETAESAELAAKPGPPRGRVFLVGILAVCVVVVAVPRVRLSLQKVFLSAVRAGRSWLNPPPAPVPQAAPQHDSFGQSGDEYNLPVVGNIPDATTDPSQIRVVPVIDPTAKPDKNAAANGDQTPAAGSENAPTTDPNQGNTNQASPNQAAPLQTAPVEVEPNQTGPSETGQGKVGQNGVPDAATSSGAAAPANPVVHVPDAAPATIQLLQNPPETKTIATQPHPTASPVVKAAPPRTVSASSSAGIPSSLKSQMASTTPAASGNKPPEAAMSSIEPVILLESAVRDLLTQPVDPEYPAAAKASGQRGSVVLQVLVGRDGVVQDAKFISGSFVFARAAIDAVKQWRFKPYAMNGRAVSVQSVITLTFKPPV